MWDKIVALIVGAVGATLYWKGEAMWSTIQGYMERVRRWIG